MVRHKLRVLDVYATAKVYDMQDTVVLKAIGEVKGE